MIEQKYIDRFWNKVDKDSDPNGCWLWTGGCRVGYGACFIGKGLTSLSHRASWILTNGPIPEGLHVLHGDLCPRNCVNSDHHRIGTAKENGEDRKRFGTKPRKPNNQNNTTTIKVKMDLDLYNSLNIKADKEFRDIPLITIALLKKWLNGETKL